MRIGAFPDAAGGAAARRLVAQRFEEAAMRDAYTAWRTGRIGKKEGTMITTRVLVTLGVAGVLAGLAATPAGAKDGDIRVQGTCSGAATAELKLSPEDGRIEVEFEVDQNRNGVRWNVSLFRNGNRVVSTTKTTRPPSGSFELRRVLSDRSGPDNIRARATSPGGQVCTARATF
jgi:hypothetical protein